MFRPQTRQHPRGLIALLVGLSLSASAAAKLPPAPAATAAQAALILNRVGFGPTPEDLAHVEATSSCIPSACRCRRR